ncbi:MAG: hypothetical protein C4560_00625 [Nitrospiraceae bacterium]|nr:MAG: hypothetical protein C4560_00625 [Nitrospiraceae bacterium]
MTIRVAFYVLHMLKTTMLFYRRRIIASLFSVYFLLYLLSPICYTEDGLPGASVYQANLNTKSVRVIWELILSKHLTPEDAGSNQPNVQLLIKKARALVSSNNIVKPTPSKPAEFDYNDNTFPQNFFTLSYQDTKPECRTGSYLSVSGISPPFLS